VSGCGIGMIIVGWDVADWGRNQDLRGSWPLFLGFTEFLLFFGLGGFSFTFDAFMRSGDVHCVWLWRGSGCCGVARCRLVPSDYFWSGCRGQDLGALYPHVM
jgi:hypothetical protein